MIKVIIQNTIYEEVFQVRSGSRLLDYSKNSMKKQGSLHKSY